jgi:flagellar basal-body rod protein FlgG
MVNGYLPGSIRTEKAVTEISNLISAQRAYEMNSKVISATDQMLQTTAQLMR